MKNIIILVPNLDVGGQERIAVTTANMLTNKYNVKIVVFDGRLCRYNVECEIIDLNAFPKCTKLGKLFNVFKRAIKLRTLKKDIHCDIVYSFGQTANIVNCLAGGNGKKFISIHAYGTTELMFYEKLLYRRAEKIFCVSKMIKSTIDERFSFFQHNTELLYNPYDFEMMQKMSAEFVDDYCFVKPTIITVGRLNYVKNIQRLIKAFSIVSRNIDCQLLIVGDGEERNKLDTLIRNYNLENKAKILGYRNNPFKYLSKSSLFVLSSFREGFPNSMIEGMFFLPVVSVNCKSGPSEVLLDEELVNVDGFISTDYGILVNDANTENSETINNDDKSLAAAMEYCLRDKELMETLKEKANNRAKEFSLNRYLTILEKFIEVD